MEKESSIFTKFIVTIAIYTTQMPFKDPNHLGRYKVRNEDFSKPFQVNI